MAMHRWKRNRMQNIHRAFSAMKIVRLAIIQMDFHAINVENQDGFLRMALVMRNVHREV